MKKEASLLQGLIPMSLWQKSFCCKSVFQMDCIGRKKIERCDLALGRRNIGRKEHYNQIFQSARTAYVKETHSPLYYCFFTLAPVCLVSV